MNCHTTTDVVKKSNVNSVEEVIDYINSTLQREPYENCDIIWWGDDDHEINVGNFDSCGVIELLAPGPTSDAFFYPKNPNCKWHSMTQSNSYENPKSTRPGDFIINDLNKHDETNLSSFLK